MLSYILCLIMILNDTHTVAQVDTPVHIDTIVFKTGDIILFLREDNLLHAGISFFGNKFIHVAVIVMRNDVPYILSYENPIRSRITLMPIRQYVTTHRPNIAHRSIRLDLPDVYDFAASLQKHGNGCIFLDIILLYLRMENTNSMTCATFALDFLTRIGVDLPYKHNPMPDYFAQKSKLYGCISRVTY